MKLTKAIFGVAAGAMLATGFALQAQAEDKLYIPLLTYRTGPFSGSGTPNANGMHDLFTMLNVRDGGIGGVKIEVEECETGYKAQKGVECYEATKGKGALVYNPYSTGITLQLLPKAPIDKIPVLSMGYGLSAAAVGEKFPWVFNAPATYWSQASGVIKYLASRNKGSLKGKKIGFTYLDVGYGREPIPLFKALAEEMGFKLILLPVGVKEMQNQASHWLQVRKERPDYMVIWGWGAMTPTALKEAAKIRFNMENFIGVWWSGSQVDVLPAGKGAIGYHAMTFHGASPDFPVLKDIVKHVINGPGKTLTKDAKAVEEIYYLRGVFNATIVAEAIRNAQKITGKKVINGEDMRKGLESLELTKDRIKAAGLEGFVDSMKITCKDHAGAHRMFVQRWDGSKWKKASDWITPMREKVRPMLEAAAEKYIADKPGWQTQKCDS
ncbi:MAG: ABC transporter substrate-binding protein [Hyphomicrobiaceae bacterium]